MKIVRRHVAIWRDVRRLALALPEAQAPCTDGGTPSWTVRGNAFAWERPLRKSDLVSLGSRAPECAILGVRTPGLDTKDALIRADANTPALRAVLTDGRLARAPQRAVAAFLASTNAARP